MPGGISGRESKISNYDGTNSGKEGKDGHESSSGRESKPTYDKLIGTLGRDSKMSYDTGGGSSGRESSKANYDMVSGTSGTSGRDSKLNSILINVSSGRESKASFNLSKKNSKDASDRQDEKEFFENESVREGFDSSRGGGDGLSSENSKEDLDKLNPVFSPMSSRDTIEPPDLFNTNKIHSHEESLKVEDSPQLEDSKTTPIWSNEKTYSSQTLSRKHSKSHSHSRSKRLRNRSLEMVLDENSTESSASKSDNSRSRQYSRSLERPKPRRADRY